MPRPISWLPRLHEIARSVANSVRSHYDRRDLEQLFELQPRAAQKLLELMPTVPVGTSRLVDREVLAGFLDRVREAEDVPRLLEQIRQEKSKSSRRKVRNLVRREFDPIDLDSLPESLALSRGRIEISFRTVEQLAQDLFKIAQVLTEDVEEFVRRFEPEPPPIEIDDANEVRYLFAELERMEAEHALKRRTAAESPAAAETTASLPAPPAAAQS
jgi:hypothetical protein